MKFEKVRFFDPGITNCELKMQHTSRKNKPYWLSVNLFLYSGEERRKVIFLGAGSKSDSEKVIQLLESQGFIQTGSRLNQEWYQIRFTLDNDVPEDQK